MRRRSFLKLVGLASVSSALTNPIQALAAVARPGAAAAGTTAGAATALLKFKAKGGRIYSSTDGRTWTLHTYLGPDYRVERLVQDSGGGVRATVDYFGRSFGLVLAANRISWLTS